jgi:transcriptional regulator with XRE-family HTH domain
MPLPFGQRLKAARVMAGLSMDDLVKRMEGRISKQAISKYENGLMMPDSSVLIALAEALGVGVDYFFSESRLVVEGINFRKRASLAKNARTHFLQR